MPTLPTHIFKLIRYYLLRKRDENEMNYCFFEGCTNIALTKIPCHQCPEGHWTCSECMGKIGNKK